MIGGGVKKVEVGGKIKTRKIGRERKGIESGKNKEMGKLSAKHPSPHPVLVIEGEEKERNRWKTHHGMHPHLGAFFSFVGIIPPPSLLHAATQSLLVSFRFHSRLRFFGV